MNQSMAYVFQESARRFEALPAFASRQGREFRARTFGELYSDALELAEALIGLGLGAREQPGSSVTTDMNGLL